MKVIGLTGGIGSGKSMVSQFMQELGAVLIDADSVGHEAYQPGTGTWRELIAAFGEQILAQDNSIDRKKLGGIVFGSPESLARLNQIMYPRMHQMMGDRIEEYRRQGVEVVVLEAAILLEAGWNQLVDEVWITIAPESVVVERTRERTGLPEEQILARIRSQMSSEERAKHADVVINNDGSLDELKDKVRELWEGVQG